MYYERIDAPEVVAVHMVAVRDATYHVAQEQDGHIASGLRSTFGSDEAGPANVKRVDCRSHDIYRMILDIEGLNCVVLGGSRANARSNALGTAADGANVAITVRLGILVIAGTLLASCSSAPDVPGRDGVPMPEGFDMATLDVMRQVIADGFTIPWAIAVLDENEYLVTERMGALVHIRDGRSTRLAGFPESRTHKAGRHYGGVMDVSLHPRFEENRRLYVAYVDQDYRMVVGRFVFTDGAIHDFDVIFESNEFSLGSRIAWEDDAHFFVSHGMAGDPLPEPGPQDLDSDGGKIHRLMEDGSIPADNPVFAGHTGPTSIWSYGHRDVQGLYFDTEEGILYATEHGPFGGDEFNIIEKGGNYGWPRFSYGLNYDGTVVGDLSEEEADSLTILPVRWWSSAFNMAPSGLERVTLPRIGTRLVWGSLVQQRLIGYDVASGKTSVLLENVGRIRDVTQLSDGDLVVLVDTESSIKTNSGRIIRLKLR